MVSTLVLLGTYLFTAFAVVSFAGTGTGTTALARVRYFRTHPRESPRALSTRGVLPLTVGLLMLGAFVRSAYDMVKLAYGSTSFLGIGGVFLLGAGSFTAGALAVLTARAAYPAFFRNGRTTVVARLVTAEDRPSCAASPSHGGPPTCAPPRHMKDRLRPPPHRHAEGDRPPRPTATTRD